MHHTSKPRVLADARHVLALFIAQRWVCHRLLILLERSEVCKRAGNTTGTPMLECRGHRSHQTNLVRVDDRQLQKCCHHLVRPSAGSTRQRRRDIVSQHTSQNPGALHPRIAPEVIHKCHGNICTAHSTGVQQLSMCRGAIQAEWWARARVAQQCHDVMWEGPVACKRQRRRVLCHGTRDIDAFTIQQLVQQPCVAQTTRKVECRGPARFCGRHVRGRVLQQRDCDIVGALLTRCEERRETRLRCPVDVDAQALCTLQ